METPAESREQQLSTHSGWGGRRAGAGRRPRDVDRWMRARGLKPAGAAEILERADERRIWHRLLRSQDDRIVLDAMKFLVSMRDGRPAQQINVTSMSVSVTAQEIAEARTVAQELMGASAETACPRENGRARET
jgi:hypothetical protein